MQQDRKGGGGKREEREKKRKKKGERKERGRERKKREKKRKKGNFFFVELHGLKYKQARKNSAVSSEAQRSEPAEFFRKIYVDLDLGCNIRQVCYYLGTFKSGSAKGKLYEGTASSSTRHCLCQRRYRNGLILNP